MKQQNKSHRIYIPYDIVVNQTIKCDVSSSHHIKNVLRIKNTEDVILFNGDGKEYAGKVFHDGSTKISVSSFLRSINVNSHKISLAQCIPSSKYMDMAIQKSVELGINQIIPVISKRSHPGNHIKKLDHWKKIIINAAEQSNGLIIPKLHNVILFDDFLDKYTNSEAYKICFHTTGRKLETKDKKHSNHIILIGPEGGFTNDEVSLAIKKSWNIVKLGDRIFRTETASIVAQTLLRDF